ncbi:LacI family DNA-binding transcriptional regulator [Alicyclobacillus sp. ALC3]|uniref:LacI family DNA-binding transcriptional regulator n=1 Tax=Alicyclobacillus sp. ALC3 TaxID=2796143 RepID=UPI002379EA40|nr:LacI family DNA-binding transcriptional regulator [Alicyclobacillus sp. ALC3]WDL97696.1 LacI family DNA-binding transcriptional regulator [Alicyclobacillus sp. ALC3]
MKPNVTATDIARLTGFSQSTVSRALSNPELVSSKTRKVILEAARQMSYQPNVIARGLITGKSRIVGLVTSDIKNPFYPEVVEKFATALRNEGYSVLYINARDSEISEDDITPLLEYKVEGVIVTAAELSSDIVEMLREQDIPVVLFNRRLDRTTCNTVTCDNQQGGEAAAEVLIRTRHIRLAFMAGKKNTSTSTDRLYGFEKRIVAEGLDIPVIVYGDYSYVEAYRAALRLFGSEIAPDAVFCANDIMALATIDAARSLNLDVPNDVSVIGFDDIEAASWAAYSLTTIRQPVDAMIRECVVKLLTNAQSKPMAPTLSLIPGELVVRASVKGLNPVE